jgi:GAF domain-containing protein
MSELSDTLLNKWQTVVDIMAELLAVPAGLIMRCRGDEIEVLVASASPGNPYHPGEKEHWPGSGLYCETVIKTRQMLMVPDALKDEKWRTNPDINLGMISYLGYPICLPNGEVFGTICVLDTKENAYSETYKTLLLQFRTLIEAQLELLETNCRLQNALNQVQTLQGLLPICAHCKKIRDDQGEWQQMESYISRRSHARFSHGVCPACLQEHYPEYP